MAGSKDTEPIAGPSSGRGQGTRGGPTGRGRDRTGREGQPQSFVVGTYRALGAFPVKGESFCSCPVAAQGRCRYLDCQCGEEDDSKYHVTIIN